MPEKRRRKRKETFTFDLAKVNDRLSVMYNDMLEERSLERDIRLQRYAKLRMWTEETDFPWPGASNIPLSDMMAMSQRMQDTLVNAVVSSTPPIGAQATQESDRKKEEDIDNLQSHQIFVEADGEQMISEAAQSFVEDGVFTIFTPWVRENREVVRTKVFPPIPEEFTVEQYLRDLLRIELPDRIFSKKGKWDWQAGEASVRFYTDSDDQVEMSIEEQIQTFDGPSPRALDYDDVLYPARAANLQMPSPKNPGGAPFVVLRDFPTLDEVKRLKEEGFYDLMTDDDLLKITGEETQEGASLVRSGTDEEAKDQKDDLQGVLEKKNQKDKAHNTLTRLMFFDVFDIDGDGLGEDVIWWYILETKSIVRARLLTEVYPSNPPRRPLAGKSYLPVKGRYAGISLLELLEGLHDAMKAVFDWMVDTGQIANSPFGFYRPAGGMNPEVIRLIPGELYPLNNPQQDVNIPNIQNNAVSIGINIVTMLQQMEERVAVQGALNFGNVPAGKSSALRTTGNMALLLSQSESRPERVLRRFFMGLTEVWEQIHGLNRRYLPREKVVRIRGVKSATEDAFLKVKKSEIDQDFTFAFKANVLNTSKAQFQAAFNEAIGLLLNPLAIQLGIVDQGSSYRLIRDKLEADGLDANDYIVEPVPDASEPRILAEEAMSTILNGGIPSGLPAEGAAEHLEKIGAFMQTEDFTLMTDDMKRVLTVWVQKISQMARADQRRTQLAASAGQTSGQTNGTGQPIDQSPPLISGEGELLDEGLPGAQG